MAILRKWQINMHGEEGGGGTICTRYYACPALKNKKTRLSLHTHDENKEGRVRGREVKILKQKV